MNSFHRNLKTVETPVNEDYKEEKGGYEEKGREIVQEREGVSRHGIAI